MRFYAERREKDEGEEVEEEEGDVMHRLPTPTSSILSSPLLSSPLSHSEGIRSTVVHCQDHVRYVCPQKETNILLCTGGRRGEERKKRWQLEGAW